MTELESIKRELNKDYAVDVNLLRTTVATLIDKIAELQKKLDTIVKD